MLDNIASLSLRSFQFGWIALVYEGDGQHEIFAAGVLDEFMRAQFNSSDPYLGTSTEAQNLSVYICNQSGYVRKVIMRYIAKREFLDSLRFIRGGNPINLGWLMETIAGQTPLQMDTTARLSDSNKSFYMCICRQDDYAPNYFLPAKRNWLDVIHASSAIPGSYRGGVSLEGINYPDGGISDMTPVKKTTRQEMETLVVIRTVPSQIYYTPQWLRRMERWLGNSSLQPLINPVQHHETNYREIQQLIKKPPGQLWIFEIYSPKPLHNIAFGSRILTLREDYKLERLCGRYFLATVGKLLAEKAPLSCHLVPVVTPEPIVIPLMPVANDMLIAEVSDAPQVNDPTFNNEDLA